MYWKSSIDVLCRKTGGKACVILPVAVVSALLMNLAAGAETGCWPAWIGLLPFFYLIRTLPPSGAGLSGALWGGIIYLLAAEGFGYDLPPSVFALCMLVTIPAVYAGLCSWLTKRLGFNPLVLAFGWMLLEVSLQPAGLDHGLLNCMHQQSAPLHWMCRLFGCLSVAFVVACTNATLLILVVLSTTLFLGIRKRGMKTGATCFQKVPLPQSSFVPRRMVSNPGSPRAPPVRCISIIE